MASSFEDLRDFIRKRMRMSHIYQPGIRLQLCC